MWVLSGVDETAASSVGDAALLYSVQQQQQPATAAS